MSGLNIKTKKVNKGGTLHIHYPTSLFLPQAALCPEIQPPTWSDQQGHRGAGILTQGMECSNSDNYKSMAN